MADLERNYRPRHLNDVVGQAQAVSWCRAQITKREFGSVLFSGPPGVGKTLIARLYAQARFCTALKDDGACGECLNCASVERESAGFPDCSLIDCAEHSKIDDIAWLQQAARARPMFSDGRVIILDEVHALSSRAQDGLLKITSLAGDHRPTFILTTTRPDKVAPALKTRLQLFALDPLSQHEGVGFLSNVCAKEKLQAEPTAIELLFQIHKGHPRSLLRALEKVSSFGPITEDVVRRAFNLNFAYELTAVIESLCDHNLQRFIDVVDGWTLEPRAKLDHIRRLLTHIFLNDLRHLRHDDLIVDVISLEARECLRAFMQSGAQHLGLSDDRYWQDAIDLLKSTADIDSSELARNLVRFFDAVAGQDAAAVPAVTVPTINKKDRRPTRLTRVAQGAERRVMTRQRAKVFYETASFLTQYYGVHFNAWAIFSQTVSSFESQRQAEDVGTKLRDEVRIKLDYRLGTGSNKFHLIHQNELDADRLVTQAAMHIPHEYLAEITTWLRRKFFVKHNICADDTDLSICDSNDRQTQTAYHWRHVRALLHSLDPMLLARGSDGALLPLVDAIGIEHSVRSYPSGKLIGQSFGRSQSLSCAAQKKAAADNFKFLSAFEDEAWSFLDSGWELNEHADRRREAEHRRQQEMQLRRRFADDNELARHRLAEAHDALVKTYPDDPRLRLRTWHGWWLGENPRNRKPSNGSSKS